MHRVALCTSTFVLLILAVLCTGCRSHSPPDSDGDFSDIEAIFSERKMELDREFPKLLEKYGVITAGAGVIKQGELIWTGYYGEQSPGIAASRDTLFDVASMTKTVTAETLLRLVAAGRLSLDESISPYWIDPDIASDPRHSQLTARIALSHSTGFLNWRFFADEGVLRFITTRESPMAIQAKASNTSRAMPSRSWTRTSNRWSSNKSSLL